MKKVIVIFFKIDESKSSYLLEPPLEDDFILPPVGIIDGGDIGDTDPEECDMMDEVTKAGCAVAAARAVIAKAGVNFSYMAVDVGGEPKTI